MAGGTGGTTWRRRVYEVMEVGRGEGRVSWYFDIGMVALILLNVFAFCLETVPAIEALGWLATRIRDHLGRRIHG
jgi:hypothetical protein